jgi:hypothetical protein
MQKLNVPLGYHIRDYMGSVHAKFHKFIKHRGGDTNLSSFSLSEFCTLEEQELGRIAYMKDVVLYEGIPTKFILYIYGLYFIWYEFLNSRNELVQ